MSVGRRYLMSSRTNIIDDRTADYVRDSSLAREGTVPARLREETAKMPNGFLQISVEQGRLMVFLVAMMGARRCIEIGVFTGYSALCVAQQLPPDGRLVACDVSDEWTAIGKRYWVEAKVADRIDLRLGKALDTLSALLGNGEAGSYDFAFIDADKENYNNYYEKCLELLRPGGVMALDNIFLRGKTFNPEAKDGRSTAVRALTAKISADKRVEPAIVPIGDGLLLVRKL
jgi:caffeoyl-CoA O-methyltransferase